MSDPIIKGVKRTSSRPVARQNSQASSAKKRTAAAQPKPLAKRPAAADKAPARKATKSATKAQPAAAATKSKTNAASRNAPARASGTAAKSKAGGGKSSAQKSAPGKQAKTSAAQTKPSTAPAAAPATRRAAQAKSPAKQPAPARNQPPASRQPTMDEAAALRAFERAHKEFTRGRFSDARALFLALLEKHANASEVAARARTYLAVAESRLRTQAALPHDADALYDRGVIELNRGQYVAAQELFERAQKRAPEAAHVHYGLAAARARMGALDAALQSLRRALELQPSLRARAHHDSDLAALRNDATFEQLIFPSRF